MSRRNDAFQDGDAAPIKIRHLRPGLEPKPRVCELTVVGSANSSFTTSSAGTVPSMLESSRNRAKASWRGPVRWRHVVAIEVGDEIERLGESLADYPLVTFSPAIKAAFTGALSASGRYSREAVHKKPQPALTARLNSNASVPRTSPTIRSGCIASARLT
jgi:hypothetical protein